MKKNNSGITLVSLVITVIVLLILSSIAVYSGVSTIRSARLTKFTTELKMMQQKVNELYDSYINNKSVTVNGVEYVGTDIQNIGEDPEGLFNSNRLEEVFSAEGSGITDRTGYMYYDMEILQALGLENMEYEFFVNVATRSVVSIEGFNDYGTRYYTLAQVPNGLYNVDYNPSTGKPTFDVQYEYLSDSKWQITISNIQYDGYINKWNVKYQIDGQNYWNTSEDLSFIVNEKGIYNIYIENGDVTSDEKEKALGVAELTPDTSDEAELSQMLYGVIEVEFLEETSYNTTTTANAPILGDDMRAVYWGNTNGEIDDTIANNTTEIDSTNKAYKAQNWYNYESQGTNTTENGETSRWANAIVTVDDVDSYFVWIPRYAYRIIYFTKKTYENQYRAGTLTEEEALEKGYIVGYSDARGIVNAEGLRPSDVDSQTAISVNDKYFKTHPVFEDNVNYGGWDSNLEGIWVAKYEAAHSDTVGTTQGSSTIPKSVPEVSSWKHTISIEDMFKNSKNYNTNLNSHLMKNSEWGAVVYLTESKYGRNGTEVSINNSSNYITGSSGGNTYATSNDQTYQYNTPQGFLASTTGNIYGIYDVSGGAYDCVVGYYKDGDLSYANDIVTGASEAYSTVYNGIEARKNYIYGDATYEVSGWNDDSQIFVSEQYPFFKRGGSFKVESSSIGIFAFDDYGGNPSYNERIPNMSYSAMI